MICNDKIKDYISTICENQYEYFFRFPNVVGVGLGYKITNGFSTLKKCITVFVVKKISKNNLNISYIIPSSYKGIKTDVVETGVFKTQSLSNKIRPVIGGYSIGSVTQGETGTMGGLVTDGYYKYILSNNHVIADENNAPIGTFITQPSIDDGGKVSEDIIAMLSKFIEVKPWTRLRRKTNIVDCAIAKVINPSLVSSEIDFVGVPQGTIIPILDKKIKKVGATSELTTGEITNIDATIKITFNNKPSVFKKQILANALVDDGDSGSLFLDENDYVVGLHMGGNSHVSLVNPIKYVLDALDVKLVTV